MLVPSHSHPEKQPRPQYELAEVFERYFDEYCQNHKVSYQQRQIVRAIRNCRTANLGGHVRKCDECGYQELAYNSCRDRHCPKCQFALKEQWIAARLADLLPIGYHHGVFTLPDEEINPVMLLNKRVVYKLFFDSAAETLHAFARDPQHLGGQIGFIGILHTWGQKLNYHVHLHFIVTAGGLSSAGQRWLEPRHGPQFLFPVKAMARVMRGKFLQKLEQAYQNGELKFAGQIAELAEPGAFQHFLRQLARKTFYVYSKPPFSSAAEVVRYLGRYTHRVAITNARIRDIAAGKVRFQYRDYQAGGQQKEMTLSAAEFIRRFLLHVLPKGFHKLRHYGFLSSGVRKKKLSLARQLLAAVGRVVTEVVEQAQTLLDRCPVCQVGRMYMRAFVEGWQVEVWQPLWPLRGRAVFDTS